MNQPIVTAQWLKSNLENPEIVILDASMDNHKTLDQIKFPNSFIKFARNFDLKNDFINQNASFPNTHPDPETFTIACQKLGINKSSKIVCYDNLGIYTSPRAWWLLKSMGHENVAVLDGGLNEWMQNNYPNQNSHSKSDILGDFSANFLKEKIIDINQIEQNITSSKFDLIDARSNGRFCGIAPEPRVGLKSGHIPNSINLPYTKVLENGKMKSIPQLQKIFEDLNLKNNKLVFTCGSGITACIILLAAELVSNNEKALYDGSWTEWALSKPSLINTQA